MTCAVAHHSPLPATYDGRTLRPTAPHGSEGQCPHLLPLVRQPSVDGLLTPMRQACPREGPLGATCVQRLDGSRDSAIHTTYRISLRSSSMREPRYPLPRVIFFFVGLGNRHSPCAARRCLSFLVFLGVIPRRVPTSNQRARRARGMRPVGPRRRRAPPRQHSVTCSTVVFSERQRQ